MTQSRTKSPAKLQRGSKTYRRQADGSYRSDNGDLLEGDDLIDALAALSDDSDEATVRPGGVVVSSESTIADTGDGGDGAGIDID